MTLEEWVEAMSIIPPCHDVDSRRIIRIPAATSQYLAQQPTRAAYKEVLYLQ